MRPFRALSSLNSVASRASNNHCTCGLMWALVIFGALTNAASGQDMSARAFFTDFSGVVPPEFSGVTTLSPVFGYQGIGGISGTFLWNNTGGPGYGVAGSPTILTLTGLPPHNSIDLTFILAVTDSWDGTVDSCVNCGPIAPDVFNVTVDGRAVFRETFSNYDLSLPQSYVPPPGGQLLRSVQVFRAEYGDSAYDMGKEPRFQNIPHTGPTLRVEWVANGAGWQGTNSVETDESWAIDNFEVVLDGVRCPVDPLTNHVPGETYDPMKLTAKMRDAVDTFQDKLKAQTQLQLNPTSGFRTQALQNHFVDIADAYAELVNFGHGVTGSIVGGYPYLRAADNSLAAMVCADVINQVNVEVGEHMLVGSAKGPEVDRKSNHPTGNAVDFSRASINAILEKVSVEDVKMLAAMSKLKWLYPGDEVHFQYAGTLANGAFYTGDAAAWTTVGDVDVVERAGTPDFFATLTAASEVRISQHIDIPLDTTEISFELALPSSEGTLSLLINSQTIGNFDGRSGDHETFSFESVSVPFEFLGVTDAKLEFVYQGATGTSAFLDNVDVVPIPEPATLWNIDSDGNWSSSANWTTVVPNAAAATAVFGSKITAPRIVTADVPITIGRIDFDSPHAYTVAGSEAITFNTRSGAEQIKVLRGSHTISAPVTLADNTVITVVPAASNLSISSALIAGNVTLTKEGAGTLTINNLRAAGLFVNGGTLAIALNGTQEGTSVLEGLSIAGDATPTARLDLTNNAAVIDYAVATPVGMIRSRVLAGRGQAGFGATWTGQGITSSSAAAANAAEPESRSVGYADNSTLPLGPYTTFRGQPVDDTAVIIAYTRTGDANLDGVVNDDDVTIVSATYAPGVPQPSWSLGDFDYNGFVDDDDVTLLGVFYDPTAQPIGAPPATAADSLAVPEPAALALTAVATLLVVVGAGARRVFLRKSAGRRGDR